MFPGPTVVQQPAPSNHFAQQYLTTMGPFFTKMDVCVAQQWLPSLTFHGPRLTVKVLHPPQKSEAQPH